MHFYENQRSLQHRKRNNKLQESKTAFEDDTDKEKALTELFDEHKAKVFEVVEKYFSQDEENPQMSTIVHDQILKMYEEYFKGDR